MISGLIRLVIFIVLMLISVITARLLAKLITEKIMPLCFIEYNPNKEKENKTTMKIVEIKFYAEIDEKALRRLGQCIDHHIEELIDLDSWPEISSIYGADMDIVGESENKE